MIPDPTTPDPRLETSQFPSEEPAPVELPAPWITRLTCPTCHTPEALLLFDGIGTVCRECGETTRIQREGVTK
jgi:hypothetical protein